MDNTMAAIGESRELEIHHKEEKRKKEFRRQNKSLSQLILTSDS
jgi:hypothetical protein